MGCNSLLYGLSPDKIEKLIMEASVYLPPARRTGQCITGK